MALRLVLVGAALATLFALLVLNAPASLSEPARASWGRVASAAPAVPAVTNSTCRAGDVQDAYLPGTKVNECVQVCMPEAFREHAVAAGVLFGSTCEALGCKELFHADGADAPVQLRTLVCVGEMPRESPPQAPQSAPLASAPPILTGASGCRVPQRGDVTLTSFPKGHVLAFKGEGQFEWGAQCGRGFDGLVSANADVVCRSLNYAGANYSATSVVEKAPELAKRRVVGAEARCVAHADAAPLSSLDACERSDEHKHDCELHKYDVKVHCVGARPGAPQAPLAYCSKAEAEAAVREAKAAADAARKQAAGEQRTLQDSLRAHAGAVTRERSARDKAARALLRLQGSLPKPKRIDDKDPNSAGIDQCVDIPPSVAQWRKNWDETWGGDWWMCPPRELVPTAQDKQPVCEAKYLEDAWMFWPEVASDRLRLQAECRMTCLPPGLKGIAAKHGLQYGSNCWEKGCTKPIGGFTTFGIRVFRYGCEGYKGSLAQDAALAMQRGD